MMTKKGGGQKSQKFDDVFYERPHIEMVREIGFKHVTDINLLTRCYHANILWIYRIYRGQYTIHVVLQ